MSETYHINLITLNRIATNVVHSNHGSFLKALADTWLRSDVENRAILRPAWTKIVKKYNLDKEAEG